MNIVESNLILAAPPVSIRKFDDYKTEYPELYATASIYIIVKRPVREIRIIGEDELEGFLEIEGVDDNDPDYQKVIKDAARFIKGEKQ